jgi:outer membrane protein assembly factor BamB
VKHILSAWAAAVVLAVGCAAAEPAGTEDWPQWGGPRRNNTWNETGIIERFDGGELKPLWRMPLKPAFSGPAVAQGKVYVTDRDAQKNLERVFCFDARTGRQIWQKEYACVYKNVSYDSGPRTTPTICDGKVYTVGVMGNLYCWNAEDGTIIWKTDYLADFDAKLGLWGAVSPPLIDGQKLIALVGGKDAGYVAFDKDTGKVIWKNLQLKDPGYAPPVIFKAGGQRQLIAWHPEAIVALNPETGAEYWQIPFHSENGLSICTPAFEAPLLFVSQSWNGPVMMELAADKPTAKELYRVAADGSVKDDYVNCMMSPPILRDGHIYGVGAYGDLRCLEARSGKRLWESAAAAGHGRCHSAFIISHADRAFLANDQGELIIAKLSPTGYEELSRARLIRPVSKIENRLLVWSHPAFAQRCVYARNDDEIVCVSLAAVQTRPAP